MNKMKIIASVFLSALVFSNCTTLELNSKWAENNIIIDGLDNEWSGSYNFLEDEKAAVSVRNDSAHLYLIFKTMDNQVMQKIFSNGLTVWIDPSADEKKSFGIHYPIGMITWNKSQLYDPPDWGAPEEREKRLKEKSKIMLNELEIITVNERGTQNISFIKPNGISAAIKDTVGTFIYEMKIPLISPIGSLYNLNILPGSMINIGIETGEIDRQSIMEQKSPGSGMPGVGKEGRGGGIGKGGGMGRGNQSAMKNMLEPIKLWISLTLSIENKQIDNNDAK
jgi:hypothetical protein